MKNGLLLAHGQDKSGTLHLMLQYLAGPIRGSKRPSVANIRVAWLRSVGPFGACALYFQASPETMAWLKLENNRAQLESQICGRTRDSKAEAIPETIVEVRDDAEPLKFDPSTRYPLRAHRFAWFRSPELRRGLTRLATALARSGIEIAQHDGVLRHVRGKKFEFLQSFRCYGSTKEAIESTFRQKLYDIYANDSDENLPIQVSFSSPKIGAALDWGKEYLDARLPSANAYTYLVVRCTDAAGLLGAISEYLSCYPPRQIGVFSPRRTIVKSCGRGLGGAALFVMAAPQEGNSKVLEDGLRGYLQSKNIISDAYGDDIARIVHSSESPWDYQRAWNLLEFKVSGDDRPAMLLEITSALNTYKQSVNIAAMDAWAGESSPDGTVGRARSAWGLLYDADNIDPRDLRAEITSAGKKVGCKIEFE